jgi:hypothetical protein
MKIHYHITFLIFFLLGSLSLFAQPGEGGTPASFTRQTGADIPVVKLAPPDMEAIRAGDARREEMFKPARMAVNVEAGIDFSRQAEWTFSEDFWTGRLAIQIEEAKALILYYDRFSLPAGSKLFVYNQNRDQLLGAFTRHNNPPDGFFANELVHGEQVVLEYNYAGATLQKPDLLVGEVGYAYRYTGQGNRSWGNSGPCQINVNCAEGDNWRDQQRGIARILIKRGGSAFWCSGSLVNNTNQDYTPLLLTADHCGGDASENDLQQWVFYFNYESEGCEAPLLEPSSQNMVGARNVSRSGTEGDSGSDFYLLELNEYIPSDYEVYYNGWSRVESPAQSGVTIHHPNGDIKKISTYTEPLTNGAFANNPNSHWKVYWAITENVAAATEPGSSGSPIFNADGQIVGLLTGGLSSCDSQTSPDYYGKFSYSWDKNGTNPERQLEPWLDEQNTGVVAMSGLGGDPEDILIADFESADTALPLGYAMDFNARTVGAIVDWTWTFEGGEPATSQEKDPQGITYNSYGDYDVTLTITGADGETNSRVKEDYITIRAQAYPNPVKDILTLDFGIEPMENMELAMYNVYGEQVYEIADYFSSQSSFQLDMSPYPAGIYLIRCNVRGDVSEYKVFKESLKE